MRGPSTSGLSKAADTFWEYSVPLASRWRHTPLDRREKAAGWKSWPPAALKWWRASSGTPGELFNSYHA